MNPRPVRIRPTREGLIFMAALAGMLWGSTNYNSNMGFVLTFLLGSMTLVSVLHTYRNLKGLDIRSVQARPVFAGERAVFEFLVRVDRSSRAAVHFRCRAGDRAEGDKAAWDLQPDRDNRIQVTAPATRRGILKPGPFFCLDPISVRAVSGRFSPAPGSGMPGLSRSPGRPLRAGP